MDLKETLLLGENLSDHWYYKSKAKALERLISGRRVRSVLDVGAGSGFFSRHLVAKTTVREVWCVDTGYSNDFDDEVDGSPLRFRRSLDSVDADLVLLMDVLEHVDDDAGLLAEYSRKVPPASTFVISVPAFQMLWSSHDEFLEHRRRYTLGQLERVVKRAGLNVDLGCYFFGGLLPAAAALRLGERAMRHRKPPTSSLREHSRIVNTVLGGCCFLELPLMRFNRLGGLTAFCLATSR